MEKKVHKVIKNVYFLHIFTSENKKNKYIIIYIILMYFTNFYIINSSYKAIKKIEVTI